MVAVTPLYSELYNGFCYVFTDPLVVGFMIGMIIMFFCGMIGISAFSLCRCIWDRLSNLYTCFMCDANMNRSNLLSMSSSLAQINSKNENNMESRSPMAIEL